MAVWQSLFGWLIHRHREQAPSHKGYMVFGSRHSAKVFNWPEPA